MRIVGPCLTRTFGRCAHTRVRCVCHCMAGTTSARTQAYDWREASRCSDDNPEERLVTYTQMTHVLKRMLDATGDTAAVFGAAGSGEGALGGPGLAVDILCQFYCNVYTICDEEMKPKGLGAWCSCLLRVSCSNHSTAVDTDSRCLWVATLWNAGLYPHGSMMNHSCAPNCVMLYDGRDQVVRCCRDVHAGEELTVAYIDVGAPSFRRRRELLGSYFFLCKCARCTVRGGLPLCTDALCQPVAETQHRLHVCAG